jgi:hypothetical protein
MLRILMFNALKQPGVALKRPNLRLDAVRRFREGRRS